MFDDFRYGLRLIRRSPRNPVIAVLTIAIGVGANTAVFSVMRALLLSPPPYADAERLVLLGETRPGTPGYSGAISAPNYLDWTEQNTVFERMAAVTGGNATLSGGSTEPLSVDGRMVSPSYFDVFGLRAAMGRTFAQDESDPTKAHVVVLSHRLWASHFNSDSTVIGKPVRLDGEPYTVIGVMPAGTGVDLLDPELWRPRDLGHDGGALTLDGRAQRGRRDLNRAVGKLKRGVTLEQARAQMDTIGDRLARTYPESNQGWGVRVQPWPRPVGETLKPSLFLLLAAVGMVLLIGCANVANLALARGAASARDFAIRAALGASRGRLIRQFLTEHAVIALAGGSCGLVVGDAVLAVVRTTIPSSGMLKAVPSETMIAMDAPVWLFALTLSLLSGLVFGVGPALSATRTALGGLIAQSSGPHLSAGRAQRQLGRTLVVAEVALAFVLLSTAGLLMQSFFSLQRRVGTGFDSTNVLTARLPIPPRRFENPEALNAYLDQIADHIQALPGVRDVAFTEGLPTQGTPFLRSFQMAGQPLVERSLRPLCGFKTVSASYFRTLGLRVLKGRALSDTDREGAPFVVVINDTFARTYLRDIEPIGSRLLMGARTTRPAGVLNDVGWEVVGVVADEGLSWNAAPEAFVYGTREQNPSDFLALVVRATIDPMRLQQSIRKAVSTVDHDQALANMETLDELKAEFMTLDRLRSVLLDVFAAIAVALAAMGLYGVLSHAVVQRTSEIGIRAALGASRESLLALVVRQGMVMAGWGLVLGLCGTLAATRLLSALLFGVGPADPKTIVAVAAMIALVALTACYVPARRATRVDPVVALRAD